jgi:ribosomal protein S18 acetylase RimI-like enzyme
MEFIKFDITRHELNVVADLIFETEPEFFSLLFGKNKEKALSRIKRIIQIGGTSFGHNFIYLAVENDKILGITILYKGDEINSRIETKKIFEALDLFGIIRLFLFELLLIRRLLTVNLYDNDLYVSNVCVYKKYRSKGFGTYLLTNVLKKANEKKCKRIILDVLNENQIAIDLYKKMGFEIRKERRSSIWNITILKMIKEL